MGVGGVRETGACPGEGLQVWGRLLSVDCCAKVALVVMTCGLAGLRTGLCAGGRGWLCLTITPCCLTLPSSPLQCDAVTRILSDMGYRVTMLHGGKSQDQREESIKAGACLQGMAVGGCGLLAGGWGGCLVGQQGEAITATARLQQPQ